MIDRDHDLPITRQAELLAISPGSVYYLPRPVSAADLTLMRRIDELHMQHPFMGTRMLHDQLARDGSHAVEVIEQAFAKFGIPEIVNTDQGSQFTAEDFTDAVLKRGCKLSMDGKGAWTDNVFVQRLWRSAKYERIYLRAYDSVGQARADIAEYMNWFNTERPHSSLERTTPDQAYWDMLPELARTA